MVTIGKRNTLSFVRASAPGLYLDVGELGGILWPGRYIPGDLKPKDKLDVFIYRDSEDRLVATTETPLATMTSRLNRFGRSSVSAKKRSSKPWANFTKSGASVSRTPESSCWTTLPGRRAIEIQGRINAASDVRSL
jgi:hypothetical protein